MRRVDRLGRTHVRVGEREERRRSGNLPSVQRVPCDTTNSGYDEFVGHGKRVRRDAIVAVKPWHAPGGATGIEVLLRGGGSVVFLDHCWDASSRRPAEDFHQWYIQRRPSGGVGLFGLLAAGIGALLLLPNKPPAPWPAPWPSWPETRGNAGELERCLSVAGSASEAARRWGVRPETVSRWRRKHRTS